MIDFPNDPDLRAPFERSSATSREAALAISGHTGVVA